MKLLIADDDPTIRFLLGRSLEALARSKFEIETACNGDEAVRRLMSNGIDVFLTDLRMPVMSGEAAIRAIREFSDVPIVVVSAYTDADTISAALAAGANRFFAKPPDFYRLASTVLRLGRKLEQRAITEMAILQRRLGKLREQAAAHGIDTPAAVLIEIEDLQQQIEALNG